MAAALSTDARRVSSFGRLPGSSATVIFRLVNNDQDEQTTVRIVGVGSSCVVLNSAAFQLVGESGKNLIKRAQIEKVN